MHSVQALTRALSGSSRERLGRSLQTDVLCTDRRVSGAQNVESAATGCSG